MILQVLFKGRGTTQDVLALKAMPVAPLPLLGIQQGTHYFSRKKNILTYNQQDRNEK